VALLLKPVVFDWRAPIPVAVLLLPAVLEKRAKTPVAVLLLPVVLESRDSSPVAVFEKLVVVKLPALGPTNVFLPHGMFGRQEGGGVYRTGTPPMLITPVLGPVVFGRKRLPVTPRLPFIV
jgi:hypothetical protein